MRFDARGRTCTSNRRAPARRSCCCTGGRCTAGCSRRSCPLLARRHRVHVVDLPGHGHSAAVAPYTLDAIVARLDAAFAHERQGRHRARLVARRAASRCAGRGRAPRASRGSCSCARRRGSSPAADWAHAMAPETLARFGDELRVAYRLTLQRFLTLQVQGSEDGRATLAALRGALFARGEPSAGRARVGARRARGDRPARRRARDRRAGARRDRRPRRADAAGRRRVARGRAAARAPGRHRGRRARAVPVAPAAVRRGGDGRSSMPPDPKFPAPDPRDVDPRAVRRAFARAAATYDEAAALQREVGDAHGGAARLREARAGADPRRRLRHRRGGRRARGPLSGRARRRARRRAADGGGRARARAARAGRCCGACCPARSPRTRARRGSSAPT